LTGERYYDLLFNVLNEGLENSVLTAVYHIPARLDSVEVNDYFTSQITGIVNTVRTVWNYTGYQIQYWSGITGVTETAGLSGVSGYVNISGGNFSGIDVDLTDPIFENFSDFSGIGGTSGTTGFLITGHLDPISGDNANYRVYINGIEQDSGSFVVQSGLTALEDSLFFYVAPDSGASILINEVSGQLQILNSPLSGQIDFTLNFDSDATDKYIVRSVDIYTGSNSGNYDDLSGFNILKTVDFIVDAQTHTFSIFSDEVLTNQNIYYKFIPRDDFDTGVLYTQAVSGYLFQPPELFTFDQGVPPTLTFPERTNNFFSGFNTPAIVDGSDGALIYQVGESGQNLYLLKSGQWKTILPYEEITGVFARYVPTPETASSSGVKGQFSVSGMYLYAATGINQWGRVLLENW
jgi:hypothetical protein